MRIYRFSVVDDYEWALPVADEDYETFATFDGSPRAEGWQPVRMKRIIDDGYGHQRKPSDFPWLGGYAPILRRCAVDALRDFLAPYGELLPLACADAELYVLNVTRVIDAVDEERSNIEKFPDGVRFMMIHEIVFRPKLLEGIHVFKIPQQPRAGTVFVDEEFVDLVKRSKFTGVGFKRMWTDDP